VIVQVAAIAWGVFDLYGSDTGTLVNDDYEGNAGLKIHSAVGWMILPLVALVLLLVAFMLREVDGALRWGAIVFGLVVLQDVLAVASFSASIVGALHGINALLILGASVKAVSVVPREPAATAPPPATG
jgi:heme A synthase